MSRIYKNIELYPAEAKRSFWDKNKSFVDKLKNKTKKTGLGPLLDKAREEYEDIDFDKLETPYGTSEQQLLKAKALAVSHYKLAVGPAIVAMKAAAKVSLANANNAELTPASRKAALKITADLKTRWLTLEQIKVADEFDRVIETFKKRK